MDDVGIVSELERLNVVLESIVNILKNKTKDDVDYFMDNIVLLKRRIESRDIVGMLVRINRELSDHLKSIYGDDFSDKI